MICYLTIFINFNRTNLTNSLVADKIIKSMFKIFNETFKIL